MKTVLVVDDKEMLRDSVSATLERAGFALQTAPDGHTALMQIAQKRPDVVVTDMRMPTMTGIELLERIRRIDDEVPVILMTAFGTIDTAVKAMKLGAFDYLTKPFEGDELIIAVKRAAEHAGVLRENAILRTRVGEPHAAPASSNAVNAVGGGASPVGGGPRTGVDRLIGSSAAMRALREMLPALAKSQGTVLVTGESGCGKEVVARAIHEVSARGSGPFLAVNCAALSTSLLESELFGHERGAFTGADKLRKGRFELTDGGTLLLDEVSEIEPQIQAKLLRVLQERAFERVGSSTTIGIDVRVVATSNRDLPETVKTGAFRQDLYFRLNVLPVVVPPLRERLEDVAELAHHFVGEICAREGRAPVQIDAGALEVLSSYRWPGNVRELQNICERAVVLCHGPGGNGVITRGLVAPWLTSHHASASGHHAAASTPSAMPTQFIEAKSTALGGVVEPASMGGIETPGRSAEPRTLEDLEREAIVSALEKFRGHRQRTATALGIGVRTLGLKLKKWKEMGLVAESL